ncbi:hypothetical protein Tco_1275521 [Tanacetum coccineum]
MGTISSLRAIDPRITAAKIFRHLLCPRNINIQTLGAIRFHRMSLSLATCLAKMILDGRFNDKLVSSHRFSIFSKWVRHVEKESPKTEKSSRKNDFHRFIFNNIRGRFAIHTSWNVPRIALAYPTRHAR